MTDSLSRIMLIGESLSAGLRSALETAGFEIGVTGFSGIDLAEVSRAQALVLEVAGKKVGVEGGL